MSSFCYLRALADQHAHALNFLRNTLCTGRYVTTFVVDMFHDILVKKKDKLVIPTYLIF